MADTEKTLDRIEAIWLSHKLGEWVTNFRRISPRGKAELRRILNTPADKPGDYIDSEEWTQLLLRILDATADAINAAQDNEGKQK